MTDGTAAANAEFRRNVGFYYDLVKANVERIVKGLTAELGDHPVTAVGVTPGWLRSEKMLENFGVTEDTWRDACARTPGFAISESPAYVGRGVAALAQAADAEPLGGHDHQRPPARRRLRRHRHRWQQAGLLGLSGGLRLGSRRRRGHRRVPVANVAYPAAVSSGNRGACIGEDERGIPARPGVPANKTGQEPRSPGSQAVDQARRRIACSARLDGTAERSGPTP